MASHAFFLFCDRSELAMIYNDRSVQESHHISAAFRLLQEEQMNIFMNLSREEWRWVNGERPHGDHSSYPNGDHISNLFGLHI